MSIYFNSYSTKSNKRDICISFTSCFLSISFAQLNIQLISTFFMVIRKTKKYVFYRWLIIKGYFSI